MKFEVTYYIKSSEIIEATSKKKARQQLLRIPMEDLVFPIEGILIGEPKKINTILVSNSENRFTYLHEDIDLLTKVIKEING